VTDITGRIGYPVEVVELGEGDAVTGEGFAMEAFPVEHRTRALGYALVEEGRPGRLDPEEAARLGVTSGPDLGALQRGETVQGASGPVSPEQVLGDAREGRRVVVTGDTAPCQATLMAATRLSDDQQLTLFRIMQECLTHTAKHAEATRVTVQVRFSPTELTLYLEDDGKGFDPTKRPKGHYGLLNIKERARKVGGVVNIASELGEGTKVMLAIPARRAGALPHPP
jgi:hypothetical protein